MSRSSDVTSASGARRAPIRRPKAPGPTISPFTRLARVQAVSAAGDGCLALALAVSVFFGLSPTAARPKVLLFLVITFVPFVVVAPLIGPIVDRVAGGRRLVMQIVALLRAASLLLMAFHLDDVLLYPIAFAALVLQKTQGISKSALVPSVVRSEEDLVEANSKLGLIGGVFGFIGAAIAGVVKAVAGVEGALVVGAALFVGAFFMATMLPSEVVAAKRASAQERAELRSAGITLAASAMALLRASVGFCFFLLAFWLRTKEAGRALVGLSIAMVTVGVMIGNAIAPAVRRRVHEEPIFIGALGLTAAAGIGATLFGGVVSGVLLALVVNFAGALARLSFDSIVQRDAPDANQGRAFAQFETKFQLAWVLGGLPAVLFTPPGEVGFAIVGLIALFSAVTYVVGMRSVRAGKAVPETISKRARRTMLAEVERLKARREGTPTGGTSRPLPPPAAPSRAPESPTDPLLRPQSNSSANEDPPVPRW